MTIRGIRILPPLAIGRLGAAATPMDNYEVVKDQRKPLGYRHLRPAETFDVDISSGRILSTFTPSWVQFKDGPKVRPIAPFLEVWAVVSRDRMEPLTLDVLERSGLTPADLRWRVHVANHKVFRRTGDWHDKVEAFAPEPEPDLRLEVLRGKPKSIPRNKGSDPTFPTFSDHKVHQLLGRSPNFWAGRSIRLGSVQYIDPTKEFPQIRLRFTPAGGYVYGSSWEKPPPGRPDDPNLHEIVYRGRRGGWLGYTEPSSVEGVAKLTAPSTIYAGESIDGNATSKGYLDDECDGIVYAVLNSPSGPFPPAYARIGAGPPAYAPDSFPVRTVADELEQALLGTSVGIDQVSAESAEEIIRRAFETIRLMNTELMNGNPAVGGLAANNMVVQDNRDTGRASEPIMDPSLVNNSSLAHLHEAILASLLSGTAPWFTGVLRRYDQIGDLSDRGRRKMPAFMRGADGRYMTLTRRQIDLIEKVASRNLNGS